MTLIRNIERLRGLVADEVIEQLEAGAQLHQQYSSITFVIVKDPAAEPERLYIKTIQHKSPTEHYADKKALIERTRELFGITGRKIFVHPTPFLVSALSEVNAVWIRSQMTSKETDLLVIAHETGVSKHLLSAYVNEEKKLDAVAAAMFYFYFKNKEREQGSGG